MLSQAPRGCRARRGEVHRRSYHPGHGTGVRRFRRCRHRRGRQSAHARRRLTGGTRAWSTRHRTRARLPRCGSAWSEAGGALSSGPYTACVPAWTGSSSSSRVPCRPTRSAPGTQVPISVWLRTACTRASPRWRRAREMVAAGELGTIRVVQAEYVQDWLSTKLEDTGHKQAGWRVDPRRAGAGGCLGDIGTHAYHLVDFVTGLHARELAADLGRFVEGRMLDDNAHILLRYEGGVRGMLWASQVAPGNENGLRLRVYGDKAGLEWSQEHPNQLRFAPVGRPPQVMSRGGPCLGAAAA